MKTISAYMVFAVAVGLSTVQAETTTGDPLAEVNGEAVTADDVDRALGVKLTKLQEQIYTLKREQLDAVIAQRLLTQEAATRGISVPELLDAEVTTKVGLVTEIEIERVYQANKANIKGEESEVRERIRASLQQRKLSAQRGQFVRSLRETGTVVDRLQPPPVVRVAVATDGAPIRGDEQAPVTLVEFSDFHCPFCKQVQPTLTALLDRYSRKVKLVFRDLPLRQLHPQAPRAAEAARCAQDQGKFWDYHDVLFAQAPKAGDDDLKQYATDVGLDREKFAGCLSENLHRGAVQRDIEEATKLGLEGTPSFFINGRFMNGAQPMEKFVQIIDEELALTQKGAAGEHR
jgi:protein-disulfide isomerase